MRDIPVGNGSLLVNFDEKYQLRDIYFPHVGQENHTEGFPCRFGVRVDGMFSWVAWDDWKRELRYLPDALVTDVRLTNENLGLEINSNDLVAGDENVFIRKVTVRDLFGKDRFVQIFLHHDFRIYENKIGDTAYFDPETHAIVHYKKHRYFLIDTEPHFDQFATGRKAFRDREGTWRDAEDGELFGGAKTEGSVDSTIAVHLAVEPNGAAEFYYWIAAGIDHYQVSHLNARVHKKGPGEYLQETLSRWRGWLSRHDAGVSQLGDRLAGLFRRSLLVINTHIDHAGTIIAAADHDVAERATDHYSYMWTRDGSFVANALDAAGYSDISRHFFTTCQKVVHERGYFLQKYNPDGSVGSGWHPAWDAGRNRELIPIQEDETALVLWALWEHFERHRDLDFISGLYKYLVVKCADFMTDFRDAVTGLPLPSWNLWEDRRGIHTFTCASVVAGLRAAANFAELFEEKENCIKYRKAADEIVNAMKAHLYSAELGRFLRGLLADGDDNLIPDPLIDASLFGVFYFGCFDVYDEMVTNTMHAVATQLAVDGGVARFENDGYMRTNENVAGNAWFICTLWLAEYYIAKARTKAELAPAMQLIEWCVDRALPSGVLSEQFDTTSNVQASVSPLTWSHSTFVSTVLSHLRKLSEIEQS